MDRPRRVTDSLPNGHDLSDSQAINEVMEQHGRMVYNTCLRILRNAQDAEDASQATFLVFLKKGKQLKRSTAAASWLYQAATFVSRRHLRAQRRRKGYEEAAMMEEVERKELDRNWQTVRPELDRALNALPRHYRDVVVLSYLEGHTRREIASTLGVPEGTIAARLDRGVKKLRDKLKKRGVTISGAILATILAERSAEAAAPATLLPSVLATAEALAKGAVAGAISSKVLLMAKGGMKMMIWAKIKVAAVCVTGALVVTGGMATPVVVKAIAQGKQVEEQPKVEVLDREDKPKPSVVRKELDFAGDKDTVVFQLTRTGTMKAMQEEMLTIYGDGRMKIPYPQWNLATHKPTMEEQRQGYLVRGNRIFFPPNLVPRLKVADRKALLQAIEEADLHQLKQEDLIPISGVEDGCVSHLLVRTNRGVSKVKFSGPHYTTYYRRLGKKSGKKLIKLINLEKTYMRLINDFRNSLSRRVDLATQQALLKDLVVSTRIDTLDYGRVDRAALESLTQFGNSKIVPEVLKNFRAAQHRLTVIEIGWLLTALCRRGMGIPEIHVVMGEQLAKIGSKQFHAAERWVAEFGGPKHTDRLVALFVEGKISAHPLLKLANRSVANDKLLRDKLLSTLEQGRFRNNEDRTRGALQILSACGDAETVRRLIEISDRILPSSSRINNWGSYHFLRVFSTVDTPEVVRWITERVDATPRLTAGQVLYLARNAARLKKAGQRELWEKLRDYSGEPSRVAKRVRKLASEQLRDMQDE